MAKVTDIQDKNGATREIQDKDLANQTSASAIASTDYVMLQDTSGGYHKIAKASFTEAVRGALGSVINSVAKGTDIAKVPVLDSNNDLGMGTLSNLASVLGGLGGGGVYMENIDLTDTSSQNYPRKGLTAFTNNAANITGKPSSLTSSASCIVRVYAMDQGGYIEQTIQELQGLGRTYVRDVSRSQLSDDNWIEIDQSTIPSFYKNYANIGALSEGVGIISHHSSWTQGKIVEFDCGYKLIRVSDWSQGHSALFLASANSIVMIEGNAGIFSTTKDTENKINVYMVSEFKIGVQKATSGASTIDIVMI